MKTKTKLNSRKLTPYGSIFYLIALFGKNYFGAFFPSGFDIYRQDLIFDTGRAAILVHYLLDIQALSESRVWTKKNAFLLLFFELCMSNPAGDFDLL